MVSWRKSCPFLMVIIIMLAFTASAAPVQVWSPQSVEWNKIIQELTDNEFTAKTKIDVQIQTIPWAGFEQKYLLGAASGDVPDVGITGSLGPADLGVRGAAVDLSKYGSVTRAAKKYGVSRTVIKRINDGMLWKP